MPRFENKIYIMIEAGEHFGHIDFALERDMYNFDLGMGSRSLKRRDLSRRFTVQAIDNCEMYILKIEDMEKMKLEFPDLFQDLFSGAHDRLQRELILKLEVIKKMEAQLEVKNDARSRFA